jgi:hypothetical protein
MREESPTPNKKEKRKHVPEKANIPNGKAKVILSIFVLSQLNKNVKR